MQKKVPYVAQLGNMDCSIACMTMLFRYYGLDVDIVDVGQVVHIGRDGVNLTQLKQATQQFGFKCTAYRYNKQKNILDSNLPAVVYSGSSAHPTAPLPLVPRLQGLPVQAPSNHRDS